MTMEIINPEYRYLGNDTIYFLVTLVIRGENRVMLDSKQFDASVSLLRPQWRQELTADLTAKMQAHLVKAAEITATVAAAFPGATTFAAAADMLVTDLTQALTSGV